MVARHPKPAGCRGCSLNGEMAQSAGYAPADGNPNSAILFVGEALGEREVYSGVPFSGDAGGMFSAMLRRSGLDRLQVRVDNVVRCFAGDTTVVASGVQVGYRRWYTGPWVSVTTQHGSLAGTPNHPVLTTVGWKPLGELNQGDCLVRTVLGERDAWREPHVQHVPTQIAKIFDTLVDLGVSRGVADAQMHFHGDGSHGQVNVVAVNSKLVYRRDSSFLEHLLQTVLEPADYTSGALTGLGKSLAAALTLRWLNRASSQRPVRAGGDFSSILARCTAKAEALGLRVSALRDVEERESRVDLPVSEVQASLNLFRGLAAQVEISEITSVALSRFDGHVYNLGTTSGKYIANGYIVHNCQPPGNWLEGAPWQYPAINHCSQYLSQTIAESNRAHRVIVTLGGVALRQVLGLSGDGISVKDFHGTVHQLSTGQFVVPTFHPSYLQRGAINMFDVVRFDIDRARDVARGGWSPRPVAIVCDPSVAWFDAWATRALAAGAADPLGCWLAVDCETPDKAGGRDEGELTPEDQSTTILRVNFSAHPDEGITVPYIGPYITIIERLLASSLIKVLWNKNYDRRRFVINRHTIGGEWWDIMWAWHRLQSDLPRGLGFAAPFASDYGAWKHLSRIPGQEAKYAAIDGFQTLRLAHYITRHLIEQGMWDVFQRHTHDLEEIVLRPAYELGVNVDLPALDAFHEHLDKVCGEKLDLIKHQEAAGTLKPKNGYAKKPKGARCGACNGTGRAFTEPRETGEVFDSGIPCGVCEGAASLAPSPPAGILGKKKGKEHTAKDDYIVGGIKLISKETAVSVLDCVTCGSQGVSAKHRCGVPNRQVQRRISAQGEARNSTDGHEARQALSDGQLDTTPTQSALVAAEALVSRATTEPRYFWHLPFNPDSSQQLLKYITDTGHSPGRAKKTRKPTSNAETLRKLAKSTGDPIYSLILDYRAVKKVDSTYALGVKKRIWADGRIHPEYTFKPSTGRLSYQNPNITNVIQDKGGKQSLAAGFRRVITAAPDCRLLEVDYSGIEAVETGWYLNDPAVIRLAKLGIHAYLTSHLINKPASLSWSDSDLAMYFKELKAAHPQDYDKAKRCVHGNNYGLTIYGMVENFPDVFHSLKEAQTTQDLYYSIVPGLPAFHEQVRLRAKRQGYLGGADHPFHYKHFFFGVESLRSANQREYLKLKGRHSRDLVILDGRPFKRALGEDSKRVIAFYPQSTSAGVLIEAMLMLFTPDSFYYIGDAYYGRTPLRAPIHDSLLLEIPVAQWDRVVANVVSVMQAQIPEQPCPAEWQMGDYLRIGVAAKASAVAGNWMDMKEFDISGIGLPAVPETARELMYTPIEDDEREDFADLGTIITDAAARAMAQTSTNAATGATGAPIVTIN